MRPNSLVPSIEQFDSSIAGADGPRGRDLRPAPLEERRADPFWLGVLMIAVEMLALAVLVAMAFPD